MSELMNGIIEASLCASEAILDIYETGFDVEIKSDDSPVTKADQAAEAIIHDHLSRLAPGIPVVAEEAVSAGRIPVIGKEFFLVDPLDGTKEFVKKNGEFTVNIALIRDELPIMGVIFTPVKGWLYAGAVGKGSWRGDVVDTRVSHEITGWRKIKVRAPSEELDVVGSRSHNTPETEEYLKAYNVRTKTAIGSSLKFCLIASGEADLYPRFSRTMEWDTAAGDAILSAAGGTVVTPDGNRLKYGKIVQEDAPYANPFFIAEGDFCIEFWT